MIKARIRWCSWRVDNILTLSKLLRLWFCFLLHSILFFIIYQSSYCTYKIISSYELARPIMGTIFLVYIIYSYICLWTKKKFESYFRDRLTFSNINSRTSRRIYRLALLLRAPETLSSLSKSRVLRMTSHNYIGKYRHLVN